MKRFIAIRSRHPSCGVLRGKVLVPAAAVYRHGSTTTTKHKYEINTIDAIKNSASKLLMKQCFDKGHVKHLPWCRLNQVELKGDLLVSGSLKFEFPVIIKNIFGSRGRGNYKIETAAEFKKFAGKDAGSYIIEPYFSGAREYRVHITEDGPVYSLRKLLKQDTPKDKRWVRNDSTCVWIMEYAPDLNGNKFLGFKTEEAPQFERPVNWKAIIEECKKSLKAVGLDIGAVDLRVQSAVDKEGVKRKNPEFYIIEINSAPSLGRYTSEVYKKELPKILSKKYGINT